MVRPIDGHVLYLSEMERNIDLLVVSHFDSDHINGVQHLAEELERRSVEVKRVWAPLLDPITRVVVALSGPACAPPDRTMGATPHGVAPSSLSDGCVSLGSSQVPRA